MPKKTYTYQKKRTTTAKSAQTKALAKPLMLAIVQAKISPIIAFTFVAFAAVSVVSLTVVMWAEAGSSYYHAPIASAKHKTVAMAVPHSQVLGEVNYQTETLTSLDNQNLLLQVKPVKFAEGKWDYQVVWVRKSGQTGSVYITPESNKKNQVFKVVKTPASGSIQTGNVLAPNAKYRVEFYSQGSGKGDLMLRKYFTTLKGD